MGVKAEVSSRLTIWSLIQVEYLMIPAPDILGIKCWVLILFQFKPSPTEQYLTRGAARL